MGSAINISAFHVKLKQRRKELGFTQDKLAEELGVSTKTVKNWENEIFNHSGMELGNVIRLCKVLNCDISYFLTDQALPTKEETDIQSLTGLNSIASARLSRLGEKNYVYIHCALNELLSFEGMYVLEKIGMYLLAGSNSVELPDMEFVEWNTLKYLEMQQWLTKLRVDVQRRLKEAESDRKDNPDAYIWDRR